MLFIVPNTFPKQMSSTIYFTQPQQNQIVVLSAFEAVLPFTGLCKGSSSQHKKSNSACSSMLPSSLLSATQHAQSTAKHSCLGHGEPALAWDVLTNTFRQRPL